MTYPEIDIERLLAKITISDSGCWIWTGAINWAGYGLAKLGGRQQGAHQAFYRAFVGDIPAGLHLDHLCRVRACVNPEHLEPVTPRENLRRSDAVTGKRSAVTHCPRDHAYNEENTYISKTGRRCCRACGRVSANARNARIRAAKESEVARGKGMILPKEAGWVTDATRLAQTLMGGRW